MAPHLHSKLMMDSPRWLPLGLSALLAASNPAGAMICPEVKNPAPSSSKSTATEKPSPSPEVLANELIAKSKTGAETSKDLEQDQAVLEDLYQLVFHEILTAETYLLSLWNCFALKPQVRPGESEPMYNAFTTCKDMKADLLARIKRDYPKLRMHLALSTTSPRQSPIQQTAPRDRFADDMYPEQQHTFRGLVALKPLSGRARRLAEETILRQRTEMDLEFSEVSCRPQRERNGNVSEQQARILDHLEAQERSEYVMVQKARYFVRHKEAYQTLLMNFPLLGFLSEDLSEMTDTQAAASVQTAIDELLFNNCVVMSLKFGADAGSARRAKKACQVAQEKLRTARLKGETLRAQGHVYIQHRPASPTLALRELEKPIAHQDRRELLSVFGIHPDLVQAYNERIRDLPEKRAAFLRLKSEFESLELWHAGATLVGYVALGTLCVLVLPRLPLVGAMVQAGLKGMGMPICLLGTGLPVNTATWLAADHAVDQRVRELFSHPTSGQYLQSLKAFNEAQDSLAMEYVFFSLGTGVPEFARGLGKVLPFKTGRSL